MSDHKPTAEETLRDIRRYCDEQWSKPEATKGWVIYDLRRVLALNGYGPFPEPKVEETPEPWRAAFDALLAVCRDAKLYDVMLVVRTLNEDADEYTDPRFNVAPLWRALSAVLGAAYTAAHPVKPKEPT